MLDKNFNDFVIDNRLLSLNKKSNSIVIIDIDPKKKFDYSTTINRNDTFF